MFKVLVVLLGVVLLVYLLIPFLFSVKGTGKDSFRMSEAEFRALYQEAVLDDAQAAKKLSDYYFYFERDPAKGFLWREKAALLGDDKAK